MHKESSPFPEPGTDLGGLDLEVSAEANDRYWRGAGIEHGARDADLLFPFMGVNFTMLLVQRTVTQGVLHTWGRLRCHAAAPAPQPVSVSGRVTRRWVRRSRDAFSVESEVSDGDGTLLWSIESDFAASQIRDGADDTPAPDRRVDVTVDVDGSDVRGLTLTGELLRTYSRAGNFHSDDDAARDMGLPGKVAMGMQTLGPAYGLLLDRWGDVLVRAGEVECRFVGMVTEGETVEARVHVDGAVAEARVCNADRDAVTGLARFTLPA